MGTVLERLYRMLRGILLVLVAVLVLGSLYGLMNLSVKKHLTQAAPVAKQDTPKGTSEETYFTGLGRIRAQTADTKPAAVVVSIVFPYDKQDIAFTEELSSHISQFRELALSYFSSQSAAVLKKMGEEAIKTELLSRFNKLLRLGSIKTLYFNDYIIIE
jgi:flagellar basal body-associated protein FliL